MGNDGGSIPKRVDLVKFKAKEIKKDAVSVNKMRAKYCAISNKKLEKPIVGCKMGYLYSKETIVECLLKKTIPKAFNHIKKLKHVKEIKNVEEDQSQEFPLLCPLTKKSHNGINKFVFIWTCGCMMTEEILKKTNSIKKKSCPVCGLNFKKSKNVIKLWDSVEEMEEKKQRMMEKMSEKEEEGKLGKRVEGEEELPEYSKAEKKLKIGGNILDGLVRETQGFDKGLYESLFHKEYKVEEADRLLFRNVRFGIR